VARKLLFLALAVVGSVPVGCRSYDTPRTLRGSERPDQPYLSVEEQERRGRARYPLPEDDWRVGPRGFIDRPDPVTGGVVGGGLGRS
jgi:hypothetical protein